MIDWQAKLTEAKRVAALNLPGRALDLAVLFLWHLNPEHGVAFPGAEEVEETLKASHPTIERATAVLVEAAVLGSAKRRGAAVRWFRALRDMSPSEAKDRVRLIQAAWRSKDDPSKVRDRGQDPADVRALNPHNGHQKCGILTPQVKAQL